MANNRFNIGNWEVKPSEVQFLLRKVFKAGGHPQPICLCGCPGIGKSQIIQGVCREFGIDPQTSHRYHEIRASLVVDSSDLTGLPHITKKVKQVDGVTTEYAHTTSYSASSLLPIDTPDLSEEQRNELHVIFFDEINRSSDPAIMNAIFQLTTEFKIGNHKLLPNCVVLLALNPEAEGYLVNSMDPALINRINFQYMKPDFAEWKAYAYDKGFNSILIEFLNNKPEYFSHDGIIKNANDEKRFPTPRAWENVSKALALFDFDLTNTKQQDMAGKVVAGIVGGTAALDFIEFVRTESYNRPISGKDIVEQYLSNAAMRKRVKATKSSGERKYDVSMVTATLSGIEDIYKRDVQRLINESGYAKPVIANTLAFLTDIPVENSMSFQNLVVTGLGAEFTSKFFAYVTKDVLLGKLWKNLQENTKKYSAARKASSI